MRIPPLDKLHSRKAMELYVLYLESSYYGLKVYSVTISNNKGKSPSYIKEYCTIASQLPEGDVISVIEKSSKGKYHMHMLFLTPWDLQYKVIKRARESSKTAPQGYPDMEPVQNYYGSFVRYDRLLTPIDLFRWLCYMVKDPSCNSIYIQNQHIDTVKVVK